MNNDDNISLRIDDKDECGEVPSLIATQKLKAFETKVVSARVSIENTRRMADRAQN